MATLRPVVRLGAPRLVWRQTGLAYLALLILVAILGLGASLTLQVGSLMQLRESEEELLFVGSQFAAAFRSFFEATPAGQHPYPSRLEDLLRDPRYPGVKRHLRRIYLDPVTGTKEWALVDAPGGGIMGVHSSSQREPVRSTGFAAAMAPMTESMKYSDWIFGFVAPARPVPTAPPGGAAGSMYAPASTGSSR